MLQSPLFWAVPLSYALFCCYVQCYVAIIHCHAAMIFFCNVPLSYALFCCYVQCYAAIVHCCAEWSLFCNVPLSNVQFCCSVAVFHGNAAVFLTFHVAAICWHVAMFRVLQCSIAVLQFTTCYWCYYVNKQLQWMKSKHEADFWFCSHFTQWGNLFSSTRGRSSAGTVHVISKA